MKPTPPDRETTPVKKDEALKLAGTRTGLRPGDVLLLVWTTQDALVTVGAVTPDPERDVTEVAWSGDDPPGGPDVPTVYAFRRRASLFGHDAPDWQSLPENATTTINGAIIKHPVSRERFGDPTATEWPGFELPATSVDLDAVYPGNLPDSWIVLRNESGSVQPLRVAGVRTVWRDDFTVRGKVTRIEPEPEITVDPASFGLRDTVVFAESEKLDLARVPKSSPIRGKTVELALVEPWPEPGQALLIADGEISPGGGEAAFSATAAQVALVETVVESSDRLEVTLKPGLEGLGYDPRRVVIYGNVVDATHGETVHEVLGGGDASRTHQRFVLRVPPLTHVASGSGVESTLEVRIDDVLWHQAPSFFGLDKNSRGYTVRIGDDGVPTILFGDGVHGARLPSGQENVAATYRSGSEPAGNVAAGSLALLQTRPLGIRSVINPLPASGGAPADDLERARAKAPLSVRTLDRLVSLRDYETFALAFPGVGKVRATLLASTQGRQLHLTVAGLGGDPSSLDLMSLQAAVESAGDRAVVVGEYEPLWFRIRAGVRIEPDHLGETVLARVREALATAFSFDRRDFGQGVAASEVVAVIQDVLRALLGVMEVELRAIEDDVEGLYENAFIETCEEWVVPYLADLLGVRGLEDEPSAVISQRARVANTLGYRRRKGTLAALEGLVRDVTGWPARAVEYFELLATTQHLEHPRPGKGGLFDLRAVRDPQPLSGPFATAPHNADLRSIAAGEGRHNLGNLGLFLWRLGLRRTCSSV